MNLERWTEADLAQICKCQPRPLDVTIRDTLKTCDQRSVEVADFLPNIPEKYRGGPLDRTVAVITYNHRHDIEFSAVVADVSGWDEKTVRDADGNFYVVRLKSVKKHGDQYFVNGFAFCYLKPADEGQGLLELRGGGLGD